MKTIKLNNGVNMPQIGFGTYMIPHEKMTEVIGKAYEMGYRQFDTAWKYHNERAIANALKENGIKREDVFITSKYNIVGNYKNLWVGNRLFSLPFRSIKSVFEESLEALQTDYIDLYLFHWPYPMYEKIWEAMIDFYEAGRFKAIGVCSFLQPHLEALNDISNIRPAVNQFEISPLNTQKELIKYCQDRGIAVEAMSTFSHYHSTEPRKEIIENPILIQLAKKYNKSTVQIVLRWMLQQNIILIPKTWDIEKIKENISIVDFELSEEEMHIIDMLDKGQFLNYDPHKMTYGFKKYIDKWNNRNNA